MFYRNQKGLCDQIFQFFKEGINKSERCVFLSTQNDAHEMYTRLALSSDTSKVTKLFSYYFMPDPVKNSNEFVAKFTRLKEIILTEKFHGRVAFNVLGDISRFSNEDVSNIENAEKYLHSIANDKLKLFCSLQVGKESETTVKMLEMSLSNHDHAIFENEDGGFTQKKL